MTLNALMDALRDSPAFQHKQDIAPMLRDLEAAHGAVPVGDDCAVLAEVATGRVDVRRVDRYRALRRELADQREREVQRERRNSRGRPRGGRR